MPKAQDVTNYLKNPQDSIIFQKKTGAQSRLEGKQQWLREI